MNPFLRPLTTGFKLGVALRHAAYRRGWFKTQRLNRPVISVGNLTVGGTGKTPLVAAIARMLLKRGWTPSILTRGYGRRSREPLVILEPRATRTADPRQCGDEPALLARALPEVPIVVCADRYRGGQVAEEGFHVDVHVLDDGFQHLALARDLNIVVLDTTQELSDRALLPAGRMREPCSALKRADCVILTRVELGDPGPLEERVRQINPDAKVFHAQTIFRHLVDVVNGRIYPPRAFEGEPVVAFCGVGNPKAFFRNLQDWGFAVAGKCSFPDHHTYSDVDLLMLVGDLKKKGGVALVMTEKDATNFVPTGKADVPILACITDTNLCEEQAFEEWLTSSLATSRRAN